MIKQEKCQRDPLILPLKVLEKKEQMDLKVSRWKQTIKVTIKINETQTKIKEEINESKT